MNVPYGGMHVSDMTEHTFDMKQCRSLLKHNPTRRHRQPERI